jgi:hypothetical protein
MSFRDELFTLAARTDWPSYCCFKEPRSSVVPMWLDLPMQSGVDEATAAVRFCFTALTQRRELGSIIGRENYSLCSFGFSLRFPLTHFVLRVAVAPITVRTMFLSVHQLAAAACWCRRFLAFYRAILVQVTIPTPQAIGKLSAVNPAMAEHLALVTLYKATLNFVLFCPACNLGNDCQFENILWFRSSGQC